ncbi:MAG: uroporphyrinogen-III C-methyltransferase [Alphaproteobacteria bacterium]|nr:uroporphyrinogen-III C-methyltransferase [Alphaproteobacteria bacterium]
MDRFPAFLSLRGERAVIVGGGSAAVAKGRLLAAAGAELLFVAARFSHALKAEFGERAGLLERAPARGDFLGARVAVVAEPERAERCAAWAREEGALVNVVDRPDLSDFITPSIVDRGEVVVAISTGGAAPALARRLREKIESILPARLGALARFARAFRPAVAGKLDPAQRRRFWERFYDGPLAARLLAGDVRGGGEAALAALDALQAPEPEGVLHIVGAGPGDPDLLTLKALRLIQSADVIFYDRLVGPAILDYARRDAERVFVGKRQGAHSVSQTEIERRLIEAARAGKVVVRLKGGDPFVFGRGGEELDAARAAGVPVFVTPGVTAATGCAAAAGMALTHRDHAQAVTFVSGRAKDGGDPDLDWAALARLGHTLVVYMGAGRAPEIAARLIKAGRAAATPVAVIENGTLPDQKIIRGVLSELGELVERARISGPTLLVIGEVAALADGEIPVRLAALERSAA